MCVADLHPTTCTHTHAYANAHTHMHTHTHTYTPTHPHTHTHTYTHTLHLRVKSVLQAWACASLTAMHVKPFLINSHDVKVWRQCILTTHKHTHQCCAYYVCTRVMYPMHDEVDVCMFSVYVCVCVCMSVCVCVHMLMQYSCRPMRLHHGT